MAQKCLLVAAVFGALGLSGCSLLIPAPERTATYYKLEPLSCAQPAQAEASHDVSFLLRPAYSSGLLAGRKLLFSSVPQKLAYYQYGAWAEPLGDAIPQRLMQLFECNHDFSSVTYRSTLTHADFLMNLEILEFHHDVSDGNNQAVLSLRCELIDLKVRRILGAKLFSVRRTAPSRDAEGAVSGFNQGLNELLKEIREWSLARIGGKQKL